jgi:hypothetical protein
MLAGRLQSWPFARVIIQPFPFAFDDLAWTRGWTRFR